MKIIHCADLHLDSKMETNFSTEQAKERRYEILATFEGMVKYAIDNDVKVILIAGDMFDTAQNQQKTIKNRVLDMIKKAEQIDFLYLQGNHDKDNFFKEMENKPSNLKLFAKQWTSYRYENIVISGIEFSDCENSDIYTSLVLNENDFNIVILHGQIIEYGSSKKTQTIKLNALQNRYIDYLALGHIHEYKEDKLDYRGKYCYSGCLEGRGFDEYGKKGFVLLEINEDQLFTDFISNAKRTFHEVNVDITDIIEADEIIYAIENSLRDIPASDIVKLTLIGEIEEETEIDESYIVQNFKNKFYFFKFLDKTELKIDYLKYQNDISLKGEFIRKVVTLDISDTEKQKIIRMGIRAIVGKEVVG